MVWACNLLLVWYQDSSFSFPKAQPADSSRSVARDHGCSCSESVFIWDVVSRHLPTTASTSGSISLVFVLVYFLGRWGSFTSSVMTFDCPFHRGGMRPGMCRDCDLQNFLRRVKQEWSGKINDVTFHYLQKYPKASKSASFQAEVEKLFSKANETPPGGVGNPTRDSEDSDGSDDSDRHLRDLFGSSDSADSDSLDSLFGWKSHPVMKGICRPRSSRREGREIQCWPLETHWEGHLVVEKLKVGQRPRLDWRPQRWGEIHEPI